MFIYGLSLVVLCWTCLFECATSFQNFEAAVRESDVEGLVGESVRLPCEVDTLSCGFFHSIKWYREDERVFMFSQKPVVKRPEGPLLERGEFNYFANQKDNWLEIRSLRTEDEGRYKCEITYFAVKEECAVVQFVNLKTLARPTSFQLLFEDGNFITNGSTIGPFDEGQDVSLKCQAGGAKPVPSVKWYNDTKRIQGRFQSKVDEDGLFVGANPIQVQLTRYDLKRKISCEIFNDAMSKPAILYVEMDVDVAPTSVETQASSLIINEEEEVSIICVVRGAKPMADISWLNGSVPIEKVESATNIQEDITEVESADGTYETRSKLTFKGTRYENGRPFTCQATNKVLENKNLSPIKSNLTIDVQFAPTVIVSPENNTLNESMDFIIFCEYSANPIELTHVYWYLDNHQLDIAGRPDKYRNGNTQHSNLLVMNASADDMGEYTCRVSNIVGASEVTNSAFVSVQYRPEVVVVKESEGPISEAMQMNLTLVCDVIRANPNTLTKVRWFYDGQPLKTLPDCNVNDPQFGDFCNVDPSRMLLENVTRAFHGNYSCEGMNSAGWGPLSTATPVIVYHKPNMTVIQYQPETVIKGQPMTLTCNTFDAGRPVADTFRWTRNSLLVPDKTAQVWVIDSASLETKATYSCVSMNSQGESKPSYITVDVLAKPTFITRPSPYHGALFNAEDVSLVCRVECSPNCTISWFKDNQLLNNNTHYFETSVYMPSDPDSGDFESVLSTLSWNMAMWPDGKLHKDFDNANYTCVSSANIAGAEVSANTIFRVEYPPESIQLSTQVLQVKENEIPGKIDCFAAAYPEPTYFWTYENEIVLTGNVLNLGFPIERNKAGKYTCVAENRGGKQVATATLDVLFKPECKIDRQDSGSGDTAGILLICRAYAHPDDVSFRWRLGNETLIDPVESAGLESRLTLDASPQSLGTYYCYVNNSVGESIPCEIDVTGVAGLLETLGDDNMLVYAIIAASVIILIIIIVILIVFCRRQQQRGKYSGSGSLHKENPTRNSIGSPLQPSPNLTTSTTTSSAGPVSSSTQPLHKWPLKPGVQVHVNSLMSLSDDSKPLFNTHSTTMSSGSYQSHQNANGHHHTLLPILPSHQHSLILQRNFPSSTLDYKRSSSSSSSASSSSNLLGSKLSSALHTLPRKPHPEVTGTKSQNWASQSSKPPIDQKHHVNKLKQRPKSVVSEFNFSGNSVDCTLNGLGNHTLPTRKRKKSLKDSDSSKKDKASKTEAPGNKNTRPDSPNLEGPTFYENLPFHGIQLPPNKMSVEECPNPFTVCSSGNSRPSSQLSHQASSGYGSTRSQGVAVGKAVATEKNNPVEPNHDVEQLNANVIDRANAQYGSVRVTPTVRAAKNALARTAAYLSVRIPKKPQTTVDNVQELGSSVIDKTSTDLKAQESSYVTTKTSHSLIAQRKSLTSFIIESKQTSTLTLHPIENDADKEFPTTPMACDLTNTDNLDITPTPAPRSTPGRVTHTYQNIPEPKKDITLTTSTPPHLSVPHAYSTNENRRKMNYDPNGKNPSLNGHHSATPSSSNASSPSSVQYQQPYNTQYPPNYPSTLPPNYNPYPLSVNHSIPPVYSQPSRYHTTNPSLYPDRQYGPEGLYPKSTNSVHSNYPPKGVSYTDLQINHNGLPTNYSEYDSDYNVLQFNGPVIGQEIDV